MPPAIANIAATSTSGNATVNCSINVPPPIPLSSSRITKILEVVIQSMILYYKYEVPDNVDYLEPLIEMNDNIVKNPTTTLMNRLKEQKRSLLKGREGSGKTTFLKHFCRSCILDTKDSQFPKMTLFFTVEVNQRDNVEESIIDYLFNHTTEGQCERDDFKVALLDILPDVLIIIDSARGVDPTQHVRRMVMYDQERHQSFFRQCSILICPKFTVEYSFGEVFKMKGFSTPSLLRLVTHFPGLGIVVSLIAYFMYII